MSRDDLYDLAVLEDKIIDQVSSIVNGVQRPFGLLLSGGFDSGLLAALTRPDYLFSIRFTGYGSYYDEGRYADAIAEHLGLSDKLIKIEISEENFKENAPKAIKVMGEPVSHFSLVPLYIAFERIRKYGVATVLSGEGPDEYLGGYARQIIFDELAKLYRIPELRRYQGMIDRVVGHALSAKYYGEFVGYDSEAVLNWISNNQQFIADSQYRGQIHGMIGKMDMDLGVIEKMEQKLAQHFRIELEYPYIGGDFANHCYDLRDDLKIRDGVTKWGFRQICMKYLPEIMRHRDKMGGPVYPVNRVMGWSKTGEFNKEQWIAYQKEVLNGQK